MGAAGLAERCRGGLRPGLAAAMLACLLSAGCAFPPNPFYGPDNGSGTVNLPVLPALGTGGPLFPTPIITGPDGTSAITIDSATLIGVGYQAAVGGGTLGGTQQRSTIQVSAHLGGTGAYGAFARTLTLALQVTLDAGPHPVGPVDQSFPVNINRILGQLPPGDPDFDLLRITAGSTSGLPGSGHVNLTRQPGGNWAVDSFFDVTYRIDFIGHAGGPLTGLSGSQTRTVHIQLGAPPNQPLNIPPGEDLWTTKGPTFVEFGNGGLPPIPAGFFGPGSEPFIGRVNLYGEPNDDPTRDLGNTDTIVRRLGPAPLPGVGSTATVPLELVALELRSYAPIPLAGSFFDVHVDLAPEPSATPALQVTRTDNAGGTLNFQNVVYRLNIEFRNLNTGDSYPYLSGVLIGLNSTGNSAWSVTPLPGTPNSGVAQQFYPTALHTLSGPGLTHSIQAATTLPSANSRRVTVVDMNEDGLYDGADIQGIVNALVSGPGSPDYDLLDLNYDGLVDGFELGQIANGLAAAAANGYTDVAGAACDGVRHPIQDCQLTDRGGKVSISASDSTGSSTCPVKWQYRTCKEVDIGDPQEIGTDGATKEVKRPDRKKQLVVWCPTQTGNCKIKWQVTSTQ